MAEQRTLIYRYTFTFIDRESEVFELTLDHATLQLRSEPSPVAPEWTRLEFHQCDNCPLNPSEIPQCPVALNMVNLVESFRNSQSYDEVDVRVESELREYRARTTQQRAVGALIGIIMVTSGCPIMDRLRPMVATHLPFMSLDESTYRIVSMYLLAQYFRHRRNLAADWELEGLLNLLRQLHQVNSGFTNRLRAICIEDASLNAVVNLSTASSFVSVAVETDWIERFEEIFMEHARWSMQDEPR